MKYEIDCNDFKVIAKQKSIGWIWTIDGIAVKYAVLEASEESAKNAGIEGAKAMLQTTSSSNSGLPELSPMDLTLRGRL